MNNAAFRRLTEPLRRRIKVLFTRALGSLVDPATLMQTLQVEALAGEVLDGVEHFEPYGFTSNPLPGFEALLAALGGDRAHTVCVIAADRRYRKKNLASGEVALYTDEGDYILLKRGRIIEVFSGTKVKVTAPEAEIIASTKVTLTTPLAEVSGNVTVGGTLVATGAISSAVSIADPSGTLAEARGYYNSHTHPSGGVPSPQMT